jgi:16S rRNA C967 or C1407 C5-methylase (RsmB/RsmF family)
MQKRKTVKPDVNVKANAVMDGFSKIWKSLFTSPVHLDSALSKQPRHLKSILAQILPAILMRPASLGEVLGVGVPEGEPWCLNNEQMASWRPAFLMAERLYETMSSPVTHLQPIEEDFPPHVIQEWKSSWGPEVTKALIDALGCEAPLGLRVSRRVDIQKFLSDLKKEKLPVRVDLSRISPLGIQLSGYAPVLGLNTYQEGGFEIQDEGSQLMALFALWPEQYGSMLQEKPSDLSHLSGKTLAPPSETKPWVVIDTCAGAGGKSLALADILGGRGRIFSYDTSEKKLQALRRRATRAQLNNIQTVALERDLEVEKIERFFGTADRVLVAAPCSGWGVFRRNPDTKWRQTPDTLVRMPQIQHRLLSLYSRLVAPGGKLTYGVCTFRKEETQSIVEAFSRENPEFIPVVGGYLGPRPCDGFFMHSWTRRGNAL